MLRAWVPDATTSAPDDAASLPGSHTHNVQCPAPGTTLEHSVSLAGHGAHKLRDPKLRNEPASPVSDTC